MRRSVRCLTLTLALLGGSIAHAKELPHYNAYLSAAPAASAAATPAKQLETVNKLAARIGGVVSSIDDRRGVPTFLWAAGPQPRFSSKMKPEAAAALHLRRFASVYGLSPAALSTAEVVHVHDLGQGAIVVTMRQRLAGAELLRNDVKVVMRQNLDLVAIAGSLHPAAVPNGKPGARTFRVSMARALANSLEDLYGLSIEERELVDTKRITAGYHYFDLAKSGAMPAAGLHLVEPARVKRAFFPLPDRVVPAYFVELLSGQARSVDSDAYDYIIAADDGRVLYRRNLTEYDTFKYRVWAETTGQSRPLDGPQADYTPHPTGTPDGSVPPFVAPSLIPMEGFNHNRSGQADPWLPTGAVQTLGNNVDAYADLNDPDGYSNGDIRALTTSKNTFDRVYDVTQQPLATQDQTMAAVTELFYITNWLHDWWYDSGFNEAAGNAQQDNYGRGGISGDPLHAEAQDSALTATPQLNNANMNAMTDGASPRMQMYLWSTADITRTLTLQPGNQSLQTGVAAFGPSTFNLSGDVVLVDDGVASNTNGCEAITNNISGKIALIDRGSCPFKQKSVNAQAAGAIGVIIANNTAGAGPMGMGDGAPPTPVTIPVMSISFEDGGALKQALQAGAVTAALVRTPGIQRDGDLDNTIVAHEWGHYLHHRLLDCGTHTCGAESEGWADFNALHMVIREGDNFDGTYGLATYATVAEGDSGYYGIRRSPYTTDMTKNGFTFKDISDGQALPTQPIQNNGVANSEVHNAGEIWALMMFESYVGLLKKTIGANPVYTYDQARRLMSDYVVGGLQAAPTDATYTEQRDGLLAATLAKNPDDMMTFATAFAKRGAGSCAQSPDRNSQDLKGVVESFDLKPRIAIKSVHIDDSVKSCDMDGVLDAEEQGKITVEVANGGVMPLKSTQVKVSSSTAGLVFPNGQTVTFSDIAPFSTATATLDVGLDASVTDVETLDLHVEVDNPDACEMTATDVSAPRINYDDKPNSSATDTVESKVEAWTKAGTDADSVWSRELTDLTNHAWHGADYGSNSDTQLVSPDLKVSATDPLTITFKHTYSFETSPETQGGPDVYWDGGVIELSDDGGMTWRDVSTIMDPGYGGTIGTTGNTAHNPLGGRQAFVHQNASYPAQDTVSLNLGTGFAGKTVKIRFRIGSDDGTGDIGWEIDDIEFHGIDNKPFGSLVPDGTICEALPVAKAGDDQTVTSGDKVTLDASGSSDVNSDPLTFTWTQTEGPSAMLDDASKVTAHFTAPKVDKDTKLTFQVSVSDGVGATSDSVDILVKPAPDHGGMGGAGGSAGAGGAGGSANEGGKGAGGDMPKSNPGTGSTDDGCGCAVAGDTSPSGTSLAVLAGLSLLGLGRRRRSRGRARS